MSFVSVAQERLWLGCLLCGSWLNLIFCTSEIVLFAYFLPRWKLKPVYHYGAYVLLLNDALASAAVCVNFYEAVVDSIPSSPWAVSILLVSTALSAVMEQTFLLHRYYIVAKNTMTVSFVSLLVIGHFTMSLVVCIIGHKRDVIFTPKLSASAIASILCAIADFFVSWSIIWTLSGVDTVWRSTQHIVRVLCLNALTSGAVVTTVTILSGISSIVNGVDSTIFSIFFAIMGRVYSLTILVNIIVRNAQRHIVNSVSIPPQTGTEIYSTRERSSEEELQLSSDAFLTSASLPRLISMSLTTSSNTEMRPQLLPRLSIPTPSYSGSRDTSGGPQPRPRAASVYIQSPPPLSDPSPRTRPRPSTSYIPTNPDTASASD